MDVKKKILSVLNGKPIPIYQIARQVDLTIQTTSKYVHILQAEKRAEITEFGNMKLVTKR